MSFTGNYDIPSSKTHCTEQNIKHTATNVTDIVKRYFFVPEKSAIKSRCC